MEAYPSQLIIFHLTIQAESKRNGSIAVFRELTRLENELFCKEPDCAYSEINFENILNFSDLMLRRGKIPLCENHTVVKQIEGF